MSAVLNETEDPEDEVGSRSASAVRIRGARRTFTADLAPVRALRGVDLDVAAGDFVAIMGPSGCGKSTLLNVIAGLDRVDDGTIEVAGERIDGRSEDWLARFRRHHIGIVFQFFNLLDGVSAVDNIVLPAVLGGMRRRAAETRARELLDLLGLGDRLEQVPAVLSGGQRQRLAIARALVNSPTLLLADEPTGALDTDGGVEVLELFRRLHADGQTVIMVTHSHDVAAGADRQVVLRDGQLAGAPEVSVVLAWLRLDLRRRWRSLVVLTLLIAIAGTVVLAALAGARRGASAITRLQKRTLPATALVLPNRAGFDWDKIRALPEVEAVGTFVVDYTITFDGLSGDNLGFPPADDAFMRTIERPVILSGRAVDPTSPNEALVSPRFLRDHHMRLGDTVTVHLPTPKQLQEQATDHLTGPTLTVRIVGSGVSPWLADGPGTTGGIQISAGVVARYPANTIGNQKDPENLNYINAMVRLRGGEADLPRFRADLARITGRNDIDVSNVTAQWRDHQRTAAFEARCLVAFALAAFLAAVFLVGQAIARYAASSTVELQTLRALGMTPRQAVVTAMASPLCAGLLGGAAAAVAAWLASGRFPIGLARPIESSPGRVADWTVLLPGVVLVPALVSAGAAAAAALALAATRREASHRRSAVATALARAGLPAPLVVGARFALETGRGRSAVPVRPALIGAFTGVLGVLAAFTFSHGVSDAAKHPERFGQTFQLGAYVGINSQDFGPVDVALNGLRQNPDVTGIDDAATAVATGPNGGDSISLWQYSGGSRPMPTVITSGRMPAGPDEVALAPTTLAALHTRIGRTVALTGTKDTVPLTVTGVGFVPQGPHNGYADGGWLAPGAYQRLFGKDFKFHIVLITLRPGARGPHAAAAITASLHKLSPQLANLQVDVPDPITEIYQLRDVRTLPIALGAFLALLAVGAVGHALATAVRRRSHDLAVLRALGMTRAQCRWVVFTQASVLCVVGLVFGVPVGLALGRGLWRAVADFTPLQYVPPLAVWALLLIAPAALAAANLLAAWPGRRAARLRIAQVLRAE